MNVYTDGIHLMCADEEKLHAFAREIGLRHDWFQNSDGKRPHYDLTTPRKAGQAVAAGAVAVGTTRELLRLIDKDLRIRELEAENRMLASELTARKRTR